MARFPLVLAALAIALMAPTTSAYDMASAKSIEKQCKAIATCLKGGPNVNAPCEIKNGNCPACVTFNDNGCYDKPAGKCAFGEDCSQWFENPDGSSTSSASKDAGTPTTAPTSGSKSTNGTSSNSTSTHTPSPSDTSSSSSSGGGSTVLIFGIIGGVIVIVAVGVIFFALIRRSRAGGDDDDEENMTPTAAVMTKVDKGPSTSTNAVNYAPYAQRSGANPTTPTNRVIQYYNDNALPSPHGGRGGGGFGSQPTNQQPPVKTVRPAVAANAPTFFKPNAAPTAYTAQAVAQPAPAYNAQPAPAYNAQPVYAKQTSSQSSYMPTQPTQTQTQPSYTPAPVYNPTPAPTYAAPAPPQPTYAPPPTAEPLFTVHAEDEPHLPRRESSPRPRRESYEF